MNILQWHIDIFFVALLMKAPAVAQLPTIETAVPVYEVSARVINKSSGAGVPDTRAYLTVLGQPFQFSSETSDSAGWVRFFVKKPQGKSAMLLRLGKRGFADSLVMATPAYQIAHLKNVPLTQHAIFDTLPFYGLPDKSYYLDEYTRFPVMEEVITEYVAEVRIRGRKDRYLQVLNLPYNIFFNDPPLLLLDGVAVFDLNEVLALDPMKIRKIDVVARKYYYGSLTSMGIVSIFSYDGGLADMSLPAGTSVQIIE